ncbi:double-strand break repair helicase AddA [Parerythrobacter jejuensis]|uniref:DNA 3'-5' helicase n=1 Tax=Parerythrobacter jejuensis TaxID=795812 RepID=A0A845ATK3_9SPHN|nr:double-strand break repair helicase AddA [Parerythrobacter jejuensis]MXP32161.1 double-strand break repair helicase AddA [Parerythrobacter jejuensis]
MSSKQLVYPLKGEQAQAVDPQDSVWLSASAGTGKTQVLSARVLRLLLQPSCGPESILCLTFTKAGAAEMATRVNEVLASWVRMDAASLAIDLRAIGAPVDSETQERARTLFARVLDCPGGGLRIDTIHAFSQWLLAAFPEEAGLVPGTRAMEDRERVLLSREVLSELLLEADQDDLSAIAMLTIRLGPEGAQSWMMRCAAQLDLWTGPDGWQPPLRSRVLGLLGLPGDCCEEQLAKLCDDGNFDVASLRDCLAHYAAWNAKGGRDAVAAGEAWLASDPAARLASVDDLATAFFFKNGNPRLPKNADDAFAQSHERVGAAIATIREQLALLALAEFLVPALTLGRKFALAWQDRKERDGLIDFDDQIRRAADLLSRSDLADWIRYKLDRQFDHILVDEAQDTNATQWSIIKALTGEFFTGLGQRDGRLRTIFVVGDYKQAIFGFQGTSPQNFARQRQIYADEIEQAIANARALSLEDRTKPLIDLRELRSLGLGRSFRTAQPVLDFVDAAIEAIGAEAIGLDCSAEIHVGEDRPGLVTLWHPVKVGENAEDEPSEEDSWLPAPERAMADRIAEQIKSWLDDGHPLAKGKARNAGPGDFMVLVRKRRELAGLIVARLHAAGIPVAGVDRLRLGAPLAVKDLMAAIRFAVQPADDLNLANLLVSPLGGWSQEDLLEHGHRPEKRALWDHLRKHDDPFVMATADKLRSLLERVDFEPPAALLHWMLTGPWQGRRKLVSRLGREANDPIDELLNAAFAFSNTHTASLQGFIQWFDAGDGELKREPGGDDGLVRVMTVHGSKGLQAPIVILADATGNPDTSRTAGIELEEGKSGKLVPLPPIPNDEKVGPVAGAEEEARKADKEEHWRLLYVAMTRAEEALYVGGALGSREQEPTPDSWYARLSPVMKSDPVEDTIWHSATKWGQLPPPVAKSTLAETGPDIALPSWLKTPVGPEPRPPRPLAPSSAADDTGPDRPLSADVAHAAARRGVLIHSLLERLPDLGAGEREAAGRQWLERHASEVSPQDRAEMLQCALSVLTDLRFAEIFGPDALPEVPLAATVGGQVIAGTVDRLLVQKDTVQIIDFKTARRPPERLEDIPLSTVKQMAAYSVALETIFPGREVQTAILYTQSAAIFALPAAKLAQHKAALQD